MDAFLFRDLEPPEIDGLLTLRNDKADRLSSINKGLRRYTARGYAGDDLDEPSRELFNFRRKWFDDYVNEPVRALGEGASRDSLETARANQRARIRSAAIVDEDLIEDFAKQSGRAVDDVREEAADRYQKFAGEWLGGDERGRGAADPVLRLNAFYQSALSGEENREASAAEHGGRPGIAGTLREIASTVPILPIAKGVRPGVFDLEPSPEPPVLRRPTGVLDIGGLANSAVSAFGVPVRIEDAPSPHYTIDPSTGEVVPPKVGAWVANLGGGLTGQFAQLMAGGALLKGAGVALGALPKVGAGLAAAGRSAQAALGGSAAGRVAISAAEGAGTLTAGAALAQAINTEGSFNPLEGLDADELKRSILIGGFFGATSQLWNEAVPLFAKGLAKTERGKRLLSLGEERARRTLQETIGSQLDNLPPGHPLLQVAAKLPESPALKDLAAKIGLHDTLRQQAFWQRVFSDYFTGILYDQVVSDEPPPIEESLVNGLAYSYLGAFQGHGKKAQQLLDELDDFRSLRQIARDQGVPEAQIRVTPDYYSRAERDFVKAYDAAEFDWNAHLDGERKRMQLEEQERIREDERFKASQDAVRKAAQEELRVQREGAGGSQPIFTREQLDAARRAAENDPRLRPIDSRYLPAKLKPGEGPVPAGATPPDVRPPVGALEFRPVESAEAIVARARREEDPVPFLARELGAIDTEISNVRNERVGFEALLRHLENGPYDPNGAARADELRARLPDIADRLKKLQAQRDGVTAALVQDSRRQSSKAITQELPVVEPDAAPSSPLLEPWRLSQEEFDAAQAALLAERPQLKPSTYEEALQDALDDGLVPDDFTLLHDDARSVLQDLELNALDSEDDPAVVEDVDDPADNVGESAAEARVWTERARRDLRGEARPSPVAPFSSTVERSVEAGQLDAPAPTKKLTAKAEPRVLGATPEAARAQAAVERLRPNAPEDVGESGAAPEPANDEVALEIVGRRDDEEVLVDIAERRERLRARGLIKPTPEGSILAGPSESPRDFAATWKEFRDRYKDARGKEAERIEGEAGIELAIQEARESLGALDEAQLARLERALKRGKPTPRQQADVEALRADVVDAPQVDTDVAPVAASEQEFVKNTTKELRGLKKADRVERLNAKAKDLGVPFDANLYAKPSDAVRSLAQQFFARVETSDDAARAIDQVVKDACQ